MVPGAEYLPAMAELIDAAVPHMGDDGGLLVNQKGGGRRAHSLISGIRLRHLVNGGIRGLYGFGKKLNAVCQGFAILGDELDQRVCGRHGGSLPGRATAHSVTDRHQEAIGGVPPRAGILVLRTTALPGIGQGIVRILCI